MIRKLEADLAERAARQLAAKEKVLRLRFDGLVEDSRLLARRKKHTAAAEAMAVAERMKAEYPFLGRASGTIAPRVVATAIPPLETQKATKNYRCLECYTAISAGTLYTRQCNLHVLCVLCAKARAKYLAMLLPLEIGPTFGTLWSWVSEYLKVHNDAQPEVGSGLSKSVVDSSPPQSLRGQTHGQAEEKEACTPQGSST